MQGGETLWAREVVLMVGKSELTNLHLGFEEELKVMLAARHSNACRQAVALGATLVAKRIVTACAVVQAFFGGGGRTVYWTVPGDDTCTHVLVDFLCTGEDDRDEEVRSVAAWVSARALTAAHPRPLLTQSVTNSPSTCWWFDCAHKTLTAHRLNAH